MSASNNQLHGFACVGTFLLVGSLFGTTIYMTQAEAAVHAPPLKEYVTIEAQLARKSEKKQQPQKELKAPEPPPPVEGVSHDEHKVPVEPKKDPPKPPKPKQPRPPVDLSHQFQHSTDDDQPGAKPTTDIGQFNGSEKGFAPINAGHPYWANLNADLRQFWKIPTISKVNGASRACFHIQPDGTIVSFVLDPRSGDPILDDSVERAAKDAQKLRNGKPQPVPAEELAQIKRMVCFQFDPNQ
jgi:hypothetical protein